MSEYSEKAYRELYSLAGLLKKFNNDLKNEEVVPWDVDDKERIVDYIEDVSCRLKFYSKEISVSNQGNIHPQWIARFKNK